MFLRSTFRWIAAALFAVVIVPIVGDFFVELARQLGAYDNPEARVSAFVAFLIGITEQPWYSYSVVGVLGLVAGAWIDWVLRLFESKTGARMHELAGKMVQFSERVHSSPLSQRDCFFLLSIAQPLEVDLQRLGIDLNAKKEGDDNTKHLSRVAAAYYRLAPLLERGDLRMAKKVVVELNSLVIAAAARSKN